MFGEGLVEKSERAHPRTRGGGWHLAGVGAYNGLFASGRLDLEVLRDSPHNTILQVTVGAKREQLRIRTNYNSKDTQLLVKLGTPLINETLSLYKKTSTSTELIQKPFLHSLDAHVSL